MRAYLLIKTQNGTASLRESLRTMPGIDSVQEVTGALDVIALAAAESLSDLLETVISKIRALPGVLHVLPAPLIP